jgi:hypothetical protein
MAVTFLCAQAKEPDADDYKKLAYMIPYLQGTDHEPLTLEANTLSVIKWWVDASYAVHPDMKSCTCGMMTLGKGTTYGTSTCQKLKQ